MPDAPPAAPDTPASPGLIVCPYCGHVQERSHRCNACGGLFEPLSRKATQIAMGPWYIRDKQNPFRPGCSYDTLLAMIKAGRITPTTILRGPTTRQFWAVARNVPGIAHHLGYCHACGKHVDPNAKQCPHCGAKFRTVHTRDHLGLAYRHTKDAERAQRELQLERQGLSPDEAARQAAQEIPTTKTTAPRPAKPGASTPAPASTPAHTEDTAEASPAPGDLLDQVLDLSEFDTLSTPLPDAGPTPQPAGQSLDFTPADPAPTPDAAPAAPPAPAPLP
ncbi:MAG: zinc-ribbon domain-containing protein, partial [Planctomycetota bacterium]